MGERRTNGEVVGLGLLRRMPGGGVRVDEAVDAFCAVLTLHDGAVAWQPADVSRLTGEQRRAFADRLRQQLRLLEGGAR